MSSRAKLNPFFWSLWFKFIIIWCYKENEKSWLTAEPCLRLGWQMYGHDLDTMALLLKMTSPAQVGTNCQSLNFWLSFCTMGENGTHSWFVLFFTCVWFRKMLKSQAWQYPGTATKLWPVTPLWSNFVWGRGIARCPLTHSLCFNSQPCYKALAWQVKNEKYLAVFVSFRWPCLPSMIARYFLFMFSLYLSPQLHLFFLFFDICSLISVSLHHCFCPVVSLFNFSYHLVSFSETLLPFPNIRSFHSFPLLDLLLSSTLVFSSVSTWVMCCMCVSHRQRWVQQGQRRLPARVHQHSGLLRLSVSPWLCTAWEQTWL